MTTDTLPPTQRKDVTQKVTQQVYHFMLRNELTKAAAALKKEISKKSKRGNEVFEGFTLRDSNEEEDAEVPLEIMVWAFETGKTKDEDDDDDDDEDSSSDETSSGESEDDEAEDEEEKEVLPVKMETKPKTNGAGSKEAHKKEAEPATTTKRKRAEDMDANGDAEDNTKENPERKQARLAAAAESAAATPESDVNDRSRRFSRIDRSKVAFEDHALQDNSYRGAAGTWGEIANEKLGAVRGKDFTKNKNKMKRGSYRGGTIGMQSGSYKFE
ncbi:SRP40, C-terminal domain-containing protein [Limtongia smithiae]|uniref:SRP40, C-terminal domain-containing protein n=1 Tax=Limtongia smithiae TaxID=1125753 RepID=UPI0034CE509E